MSSPDRELVTAVTRNFNRPIFLRRAAESVLSQQWMLLRLEECPHLTVRGLAAELAQRGYRVSPEHGMASAAPSWLQLQKSLFASEQDRPETARRDVLP